MLSKLAATLPTSGIRAMMRHAAAMDDVVHLEVGEPSFNTPEHIVEAAFAAARRGATGYTPAAGLPSLREAVAERVSARWERPVAPDQVIVTSGAVNALALAALATLDEGDEVLLPDPGWPNYLGMLQLTRVTPRFYPLDAALGYVPDPDRVAALVTPRTRAMVLNNPGNPTGAVFGGDVVRALARIAEQRGFRLIADEIYEDLVYDAPHVSAARAGDEVIYVSGCSKSYAMTGWRLGFAVAPPAVVDVMERLTEPLTSCPSSLSQAAAETALRGPQDCVAEMREAYRRRRDIVVRELAPAGMLPVTPKGGFFALVELGEAAGKGLDAAMTLLSEARVATVPGAGFGSTVDTAVRLSFAAPDDAVREGCARLLEFHAHRRAEPAAR